ncbi:flagellar brake protein [Sulfoacidibacillus thermotolerans]|uniref:PilZ domain-containing protein n=1 Tax=Sulfoacidibacillus thermotolerans TaxID=1765684 RepID=A0A2U3DCQ1_SULT2|nr:PilZ domain-containing protein [Sulfoacidibacillus thermotolerans]PWI59061.1 hypothetical protein BM613_00145 [Sulfoacidibacillus thermotolerans]
MALPKLGQKISIVRLHDNVRADARVIDLTKTAVFFDIPMITNRREELSFMINDLVLITYSAMDGSLHQFETSIVRQVTVGALRGYEIPRPATESIKRIQRRAFVRVPATFPVAFLVTKKEGEQTLLRGKGMTHDISAGGMRFHPDAAVAIEPGDAITVQFSLPNDAPSLSPISAKGLVLRAHPHEVLPSPVFSIRFTDISSSAQQRIIQYAFKRQLELRAKGLG